MASFTNRFFTVRASAQELCAQIVTLLDQKSGAPRDLVARPHLNYALERARAAQIVTPVNFVQERDSTSSRDAYERFLSECQDAGKSDRAVNHILDTAVLAVRHALDALRHAREAQQMVDSES